MVCVTQSKESWCGESKVCSATATPLMIMMSSKCVAFYFLFTVYIYIYINVILKAICVCREKWEKKNIRFHNNGTVTFNQEKIYVFDESQSVGLEDDVVVVPNIPMLVREFFYLRFRNARSQKNADLTQTIKTNQTRLLFRFFTRRIIYVKHFFSSTHCCNQTAITFFFFRSYIGDSNIFFSITPAQNVN